RGIELVEVASGYRLQSHESVSNWVANLFQEKAPRYSRALLETLVLIAYRQPITRAEIEDVRGVAVSSNIIKTLQERNWVKVLGHKDVPGKPALLGTSKEFLDYFNLKKLDDLPDLADIKDLDQFDELLAEEVGEVGEVDEQGDAANDENGDENQAEQHADSADGADQKNDPTEPDADVAGEAILDLGSDDAQVEGAQVEGAQAEGAQAEGAQAEGAQAENISAEDGAQLDAAVNSDSQDDSTDSESTDNDSGDNLEASDDVSGDASGELEEIDDNEDHSETLSGPERDLLKVISDFSEEHQQEVDARDEMEAGILSNKDAHSDNEVSDDADELDGIDLADLSQRVADETHNGDMPEPGDTLH
ncbi:UNVERIFIED_CONTAM: hypothetical protein GTU68_005474, partial [Idotea baltica]|nr:hypothetical protein [Idotea baltica]